MNNKYVCDIPMNRLKHCYMVGKVMEYVARDVFNLPEQECQEMFFLGNIHDSMYDFETDEHKHNEILSQIVSERYARTVLEHSKVTEDYQSVALDLLYFADQIVDGYGNVCSFDARVADILERHGLEDGVYQDTVDIVSYLRERGYEDIEQKVLQHFCIEFNSYENMLKELMLTAGLSEEKAYNELINLRKLVNDDITRPFDTKEIELFGVHYNIIPSGPELVDAILTETQYEYLQGCGFIEVKENEHEDVWENADIILEEG